MKSKEDILRGLQNYDLTDAELDQLASEENIPSQLELEEKAHSLANELFIPGYNKLVTDVERDITNWLDTVELPNTNKTTSHTIMYKLLGLAATIAILLAVIFQPWQAEFTHQEKGAELKRLAMLSFESSGLLSGERGENEANQEFVQLYKLLSTDQCAEITQSGVYLEQELWAGLYCAWKVGDEKEYQSIENYIITHKFPNYKLLTNSKF